MFRRLLLSAALVLLVALNGASGARPQLDHARLTLWAWERPEQLRFIQSHDVGVAFLAGTVYLDDQPVFRPRLQPLQVNSQTPLTAVVRLELTPRTPNVTSPNYTAMVVEDILQAQDFNRVRGLQIDFDATRSQREFYRALLRTLRAQLPPRTTLSITALGSWCLGDDWISELPIDEAVPMLFRMGIDRGNILHALQAGEDFHEPLCRSSIGISTDEPWPERLTDRRIYIFNPHAWNSTSFAIVSRKLAP